MSLFGMELRKRRKRTAGLLSTHEVGVSRKDMKRHNRQRGSDFGRFVGSWAAVSLGLFACYTAMHYVPALVSIDKILGRSGPKMQSAAITSESRNPLAPYIELFNIDRTYLRRGQSIRAQYSISRGTAVDLRVVKCASAIVVEVFRCDPVAADDVRVTSGRGSKEFRFAESGFYHFYDVASAPADADYTVIWSRG